VGPVKRKKRLGKTSTKIGGVITKIQIGWSKEGRRKKQNVEGRQESGLQETGRRTDVPNQTKRGLEDGVVVKGVVGGGEVGIRWTVTLAWNARVTGHKEILQSIGPYN